MKRLLFIVTIAFSSIVNAQNELTFKINSIENEFETAWDKIKYKQNLSGHYIDSNLEFNPILKLIFNKKLNVDSLILKQPQLSIIIVNDGLNESAHYMNAISFIETLNFNQYSDTNLYTIDYESIEIRSGDLQEIFRIYKNGKRIRRITFEYETQSNLIRLIRDAHMK